MTPFQRFLIRRRARQPDSPGRDEMLVELLSGIEGCVIEVGCGTGFLFPQYPSTVTELTAIEPESEARLEPVERPGERASPDRVIRHAPRVRAGR